jgi:ribulose 1,5-bisphosphate synthetase/thiazole synthase
MNGHDCLDRNLSSVARPVLRFIAMCGILTSATSLAPAAPAVTEQADVIVVGATPGGIAAAVAAARLGRLVLIVEYHDHIGGIVSNGLTNADLSKKLAVSGMYDDFRDKVLDYYERFDAENPAKPNLKATHRGYLYEAHVAERLFHQMLDEQAPRITLRLSHELKEAVVQDGRLKAIVVENLAVDDRSQSGKLATLEAKVFVDATYEGDLAAMSGVVFHTGRESRSDYDEPHAGVVYMLHGKNELLPGSTGAGDNATEAYCFRFHVTNVASNRVAIQKPKAFDRNDYRFVLEEIRSGKIAKFRDVIQVIPMPNGKFELNSDHPHADTGVPSESLDLAEDNWAWPEATPRERQKIYERYLTHNVGLLWLLQNDSEVPQSLREDALQYGWCRDEWPGNGHVPRQVYVRQGRRIVGRYVLTERDADVDPKLGRTRVQPTSIGIVEWSFDSHGCHKFDPSHPGVREGYTMVKHEPFQIPYGVLVPRTIDGLLVPVACSCSHVAYNALRMEPVFMALGQASGIAAHLAIRDGVSMHKVPTSELQSLLVADRGVITYYADLRSDHEDFAAMQWLGARGMNLGYEADLSRTLSRAEGASQLSRILTFDGKPWSTSTQDSDAPLLAGDLATWLDQAGYKAEPNELKGLMSRPLTNATFARIVYRTLTAK